MILDNIREKAYNIGRNISDMLFKKLKQAWSNWLNRMASQNKAAFGSETLDCCRVGRENHKATPHN